MYNNDAKFQTDYEYNHSLDAYMQQSYKMPYQPKSLSESLAILKEYKDTLTNDKYASIESTIRGQAIAHQYCDREDIDRLVRLAKDEITYAEGKKEIAESIEKMLEHNRRNN
jgi:hypothetical protein